MVRRIKRIGERGKKKDGGDKDMGFWDIGKPKLGIEERYESTPARKKARKKQLSQQQAILKYRAEERKQALKKLAQESKRMAGARREEAKLKKWEQRKEAEHQKAGYFEEKARFKAAKRDSSSLPKIRLPSMTLKKKAQGKKLKRKTRVTLLP